MSHTKNKSGSPRFQVGNKVRVKYGVIDPDFPDIPLGGWSGTIKEVEQADDQIDLRDRMGQANSRWHAPGLPQAVRAGRTRNGDHVAG